MEIIAERQLTRLERLALLMRQIEELEEHGFGELVVKIHKHQITDSQVKKDTRMANTSQEWYIACG